MGQATSTEEDRHSGLWTIADTLWAVIAAFGTYFCMYGFRKPFTAALYPDLKLAGIDYKTILVTSQVLGYAISKFIGIKVIAEMSPRGRAKSILILIAVAEASLALFAVIPPPYNFFCLFLNGLPLGLVFGLVIGFLEGRRMTEALTAGLCASFILADGFTKSVGSKLLSLRGISEFEMPVLAGLIFLAPLFLFVWMLTRIPPPNAADVAQRTQRIPMDRAQRLAFLKKFGPGLFLLVSSFLLITILRSLRADFAAEIWRGLGYSGQPTVFTTSELAVMLGVVLICGLSVLIRDNRRAFFFSIGTSIFGAALIVLTLFGFRSSWWHDLFGANSGFAFMVLIGLGLYLPYVAAQATIFERLIAMSRDPGNIGFLIYVADAVGYLGYVVVMFGRQTLSVPGGFFDYFVDICWVIGIGAGCSLLGCYLWFRSARF